MKKGDLVHADRHLPHRLASVHQVGDVQLPTDLPHPLHILHQPRVRGHVAHGHQPGPEPARKGRHLPDIDSAPGPIRGSDHLDPEAPCQGEVLNLIGYVVVPGREDVIPGFELDGG